MTQANDLRPPCRIFQPVSSRWMTDSSLIFSLSRSYSGRNLVACRQSILAISPSERAKLYESRETCLICEYDKRHVTEVAGVNRMIFDFHHLSITWRRPFV